MAVGYEFPSVQIVWHSFGFFKDFGKSLGFLRWGQEGQGNSFRTLMSELPSAASYLANYSRVIGAVFAWKPGENS